MPSQPFYKKHLGWIVFAVIITLIVGTIFWINRPITPVNLSDQEHQTLEAKIAASTQPQASSYEASSKTLTLTEREINGLLNKQNETLAQQFAISLANNSIILRVDTVIDEQLPILGGQDFKGSVKFSLEDHSQKSLYLDDVTLWGISLPNAWLGDLKGVNLLSEAQNNLGDNRLARGIESIKIERGQISIQFAE